MASTEFDMTLGAKAAMRGPAVTAQVTVNVIVTRRYIWIMKLRYIWAIVRMKVGEPEQNAKA